MKRINIIGTTGTGKSTLAKEISDILGVPCIHMDQLYWRENWQGAGDEEFFADLKAALSTDSWVLDGNYDRTREIKWERVDTLIWLDYSFPRMFSQLLRRTISRALFKPELWPGTGNRESFRMSFFSTDSILLFQWRTYKSNRVRYRKVSTEAAARQLKFIRLRNPGETRCLLKKLQTEAGENTAGTPASSSAS